MPGLSSRILCAVPQTLDKHLEIAKAIRSLVATDDRLRVKPNKATANHDDHDLIAEIVQDALQILSKAGFNPDESRVPAGNPDGGQWTRDGGPGGANDPRILADARPDNTWQPSEQYAANDSPGIGHNRDRRLRSRLKYRPECWRRGKQ